MDKAEKYATKIHDTALAEGEKYAKEHGQSIIEEVAYGRGFKAGAIRGYHQAEKDLELTWEDIKDIDVLISLVDRNETWERGTLKDFYTEVLRRFKEIKEKEQ